jgi:hypothetical protein
MSEAQLEIRRLETAMARANLRRSLYQRLDDLDLDSDEARQAVDMVIEIAEAIPDDNELTKLWNDFTFTAVALKLYQRGEQAGW